MKVPRLHTLALYVGICLLAAIFFSPVALGQGCVAAHSEQPVIVGLTPNNQAAGAVRGHDGDNKFKDALDRLTVTVGFRQYYSYKHYVGTVYQAYRAALHNQVTNNVGLYDFSINYQLTPRWSIIADVPAMAATRHQEGNINSYRVGGIGDVTIGAQAWVFRPPTENHGNVNFSVAMKLPTGIYDAQGTTILSNGKRQVRPFDESIQPGDGGWGFTVATEAYHPLYFQTMGYFTGSWLFNPMDTNGVKTFRSAPHEDVISIADQYLWRGGFSHAVPKVRGLALSIGGRMEGVPVRDAFGASDGFRRPGYVISIEPGLAYSHKKYMVNISGPWAMERNRKISTSDMLNHTHGDAAFADYTILASFTTRF